MLGKTVQEINVGDTASFNKSVTEYDVYSFAGITGDFNPAHINAVYASETSFGRIIAHGILSIGFISNVLGTQLPGPGSIYIHQECDFKKPVFIGDTITATVKVTKKDEAKNRVWLHTYCTNQRDEIVVDGEAIMMPTRKKPA
ncbi:MULTISPECIES: MaoC family dehydratase [Syntrophomonas]|jgi:3-hydroxybutyryl-CoA dehydratase|uniref:MaoC family dehydratase n=1 Tax=Syntrophomonas TaxID=862 RepID=UPI0007739DAF|nr:MULTISPECIES: MaoC family dehydratase [Syntrophomonas]MDD4626949.1 MaoC family dehydratase [Syntrophomonas sp.]